MRIFMRKWCKSLIFNHSCGEGGIRTPGTFQFNSFQDCRNRPLYHLSFPKRDCKINQICGKTIDKLNS